MIKGYIQEDMAIINKHAPNTGAHKYIKQIRAPKYIKQILIDIKGEIEINTIIVGNFNTPLTQKNRLSKQKMNKETQALNDTLNEMELIDIFGYSI